jgi:hypothetical protein
MPKLGMDVGFQGESGSRSDIAKLSRLTLSGLRADDPARARSTTCPIF